MVGTKTIHLNEDNKRTSGIVDTQCPNCKTLRRSLIIEESHEYFQKIAEGDWVSEVFPRVADTSKLIWVAIFDEALVFPCSRNFTTNDKRVGTVIQQSHKTRREVAMITYTIGFPDSRKYLLSQCRVETWEKMEDETLYRTLKVNDQLLSNQNTKIAVHVFKG